MGKLLELLAEKHGDWIKMALSIQNSNKHFGLEDANELVQEMYLKLSKFEDNHQHLMYNNEEVNTFYVYVTLKSIFVDSIRYKKKYPSVLTEEQLYDMEGLPSDEIDIETEKVIVELEGNILAEINTWTHYDRTLFNIIYVDGTSMRELSRVTKISLSSIFNTCKSRKQILRDKFQDDFDKLINKKK